MTDLARLLLDELGPAELRELAGRLAPYLPAPGAPAATVYTPATLAAELGRSERSIRAAIARGELEAVRRGRGFVISAEAVGAWTRTPRVGRRTPPRSKPRSGSAPSVGPMRRGLNRRL